MGHLTLAVDAPSPPGCYSGVAGGAPLSIDVSQKSMPHWILVSFGIIAAIFAVAQFKVRKTTSALAYAAYALSFFIAPWPQVLTYLAVVAVLDGFVDFFRFVIAGGEYPALRLTEKGKQHFLRVELASVAIRSGLLVAAWRFIGF
jgi:hypothetical protein